MPLTDSPFRLFLVRTLESLACLLLGWWLGTAAAAKFESQGELVQRAVTGRELPPANTQRTGQTAVVNPAPSVIANNDPKGAYSQWVELPASLVKDSECEGVLGVLNASSPSNALTKTALFKDLLRLTPREHEALANALLRTMERWAQLQVTGLHRDEGSKEWQLAGDAGQLKALGQRLQADLLNEIGPEKTGLFNALVYQNLRKVFQPTGLTATLKPNGDFILETPQGYGHSTNFYGKEAFGPAGIIAKAIERLQRQEAASPPVN